MSKNNSNNLPLDSVFFYMSKKTAILITVALILGAVSLYLWLDSIPPSKIQIASRNIRVGGASTTVFLLDPAYPMTRVKVISVADAETNQHPHVLWELVPAGKPVTKDQFVYGESIAGMKPFIPDTKPEPLDPNTKYQLLVTFVKNVRGECVFNSKNTK
jgi:hypothetical protein